MKVPHGTCHCGCGAATSIATRNRHARGQVKGEPVPFIRGHHRRRDPVERFWEKVDRTGGCWIWTAAEDGKGYGAFGVAEGLTVKAHRFAYEDLAGPVPAGLQLDHLCRNRLCVNPDHLEPVTNRENTIRGLAPSTNAARLKARTHCKYGHEFTAENTRLTREGWRDCRACRRQREAIYRLKRLI